jgi:hypothetical protein
LLFSSLQGFLSNKSNDLVNKTFLINNNTQVSRRDNENVMVRNDVRAGSKMDRLLVVRTVYRPLVQLEQLLASQCHYNFLLWLVNFVLWQLLELQDEHDLRWRKRWLQKELRSTGKGQWKFWEWILEIFGCNLTTYFHHFGSNLINFWCSSLVKLKWRFEWHSLKFHFFYTLSWLAKGLNTKIDYFGGIAATFTPLMHQQLHVTFSIRKISKYFRFHA